MAALSAINMQNELAANYQRKVLEGKNKMAAAGNSKDKTSFLCIIFSRKRLSRWGIEIWITLLSYPHSNTVIVTTKSYNIFLSRLTIVSEDHVLSTPVDGSKSTVDQFCSHGVDNDHLRFSLFELSLIIGFHFFVKLNDCSCPITQ